MGGRVSSIYGGGHISGANANVDMTGDVYITVNNASIGQGIYGGGSVEYGGSNSSANIVGNIKITFTGSSTNTIHGGAYISGPSSTAIIMGSTDITVSDSSVVNYIFGGGVAAHQNGGGDDATVYGDTNITINDGTIISGYALMSQGIRSAIHGGGRTYQGNNIASILGDTNIVVNGGTINGAIFGGGYGYGGDSIVRGNTNITINSGTFSAGIFGGWATDFSRDTVAVLGNAHITLRGDCPKTKTNRQI